VAVDRAKRANPDDTVKTLIFDHIKPRSTRRVLTRPTSRKLAVVAAIIDQ
jgi:hypothetical protein